MSPILPRFLKRRGDWKSGGARWSSMRRDGGDEPRGGVRRKTGFLASRMLRILSGGDWSDKNLPSAEDRVSRRHTAFLFVAGSLVALWIYFYFAPPAV